MLCSLRLLCLLAFGQSLLSAAVVSQAGGSAAGLSSASNGSAVIWIGSPVVGTAQDGSGWGLITTFDNEAPRPNSDVFTLEPGASTNVSATQLLANDLDPDGDPLQLLSISAQAGGSAILNVDTVALSRPFLSNAPTLLARYVVSDGELSAEGLFAAQAILQRSLVMRRSTGGGLAEIQMNQTIVSGALPLQAYGLSKSDAFIHILPDDDG